MNFYTFEYEKKIDFESISFDDSEYIQTIKNKNYFFFIKNFTAIIILTIGQMNKKETKTGVVSGLEQLKEQVFILIDTKEKHIFSSLESLNKTNGIITTILELEFKIYNRLVDIEEFESKISKLTGISIKPQSLQQKIYLQKDLLNLDNQMIDLSEAEDFKLDISYNLSANKKKVVRMYKKLVEEFNVGDITFKGSDDENLFQFNKNLLLKKIPIKLTKNGEGNIYDYKEVYELLTNQL